MPYASRHPALNAIFVENALVLHGAIRHALDGLALVDKAGRERAARLLEVATLGAFLSIALKGDAAAGEARQSIVDSIDLVLASNDRRCGP